VGGAKIARGLYRTLPANSLSLIVNTADDTEHWGLHVSPDLDTVTYTLAGMAGERGWGIRGDSFSSLAMMGQFGAADWFRIGDGDLATDVFRTMCLRGGDTLSNVAAHIASSLGVRARILPMTDARVATQVRTGQEWIDFQEYFVHRGHGVPVDEIRYVGVERAAATPAVLQALSAADVIVLANSNPVLSILPVLSVGGVRSALRETTARRVAVSPMLGTGSIAGPAGDLMHTIGQPPTSLGVARAYHGLIDGIVIAREDADQAPEIEALGIRVLCTDTIMRDDADKERLAGDTVAFAMGLR
jgi:LPPG:FO 2-phospho-L-lactate transferase